MEANRDRISSLPKEIQASILSFVPINDAVRTSALSRHWLDVWTYVTDLDIDESLDLRTRQLFDVATSFWMGLVDRLIQSLRGPVRSFSLSHLFIGDHGDFIARNLIALLGKGGLEVLQIFNKIPTEVPIVLPQFDSLETLELNNCRVSLQDGFKGFYRLKTLKLHYVNISRGDFEELINTSENLSAISINFSSNPDSIVISSPKLEFLHLSLRNPLKCVRIAFAPSLIEVYVRVFPALFDDPMELTSNLIALFGDLARAEAAYVRLFGNPMTCLNSMVMPPKLPGSFLKLQRLDLTMDSADIKAMDAFFCLVRSSPYLQTIVLEVTCNLPHDSNGEDPNATQVENYWRMQESFQCLDNSLLFFKMSGINLHTVHLVELAKFVLRNAKKLRKMEVNHHPESATHLGFLIELTETEMVSEIAELVIISIRCDN